MLIDKRLYFAAAASVLLNSACVALVGEATLHRQPPPSLRSAASLHPAMLQMASSRSVTSESGDTTGQPGSGGAGTAGRPRKPADGPSPGKASDQTQPGKHGGAHSVNERTGAKPSKVQAAVLRIENRLERLRRSGVPLTEAQRKLLAEACTQGTRTQGTRTLKALLVRDAGRPADADGRIRVITHPVFPGRNSHPGAPSSSISPRMVRYPKRNLDLGTIHLTRPKQGVTGGGSSDLRAVAIKVHYVVDDPNNVPKTLKPDRIVRRFPSNCKGDPGNTSRCLPTGGNTRLGGTTLHGLHDQISGVKYCVPGGGGIPGGGAGQSQAARAASDGRQDQGKNGAGKEGVEKEYGKLAGSRRVVSQLYSHPYGRTPASSMTIAGWLDGHLNPNEPMATTINPLHLPAGPGDFRGLVPGAEAPEQDRKWVSDPQAHRDAAPPGVQTSPMPRFTASLRSIGSMSKFGTINWGTPVKVRHKKQPYGGDGSGLLGAYYLGNNFNRLVLTRPDRSIDYDWSGGPPDPRIPWRSEYSVRWQGKLVPKVTDTYTLMTGSDDGVRLYLDGHLLISNWTVHGPSEDTAKVSLIAGHEYRIKVEYYENSYGVAAMKLYWESPRVPREYVPEQCLRYPKSEQSPQ